MFIYNNLVKIMANLFKSLIILYMLLLPILANAHIIDEPVLVIRFNQENVYYESSIKVIAQKVLKSNPSANFIIQSIRPQGRNEDEQNYYNEISQNNTSAIIYTMQKYGININNIMIKDKVDKSFQYNEIYIYLE